MTHLSSKVTPYNLFIEPYCKGCLMMKEACQKQITAHILCNRVVHFIIGVSLLIPIVNTIVTLVLRCFCKAKEGSTTSTTKSLESRASVTSQEKKKIDLSKTQETTPTSTQPSTSSKKQSSPEEKAKKTKESTTSKSALGRFENCPDVLIEKIYQYLPLGDKISFARANKHLHKIARTRRELEISLGSFRKCPDVVIDKIGQYLPYVDLVKFSRANKYINHVANKAISKEKTEAATFLRAINLMFHSRTLKNHARFIKFTKEERAKRHQELLETIAKIDTKLINQLIAYRDGMITRGTTLLIHALCEIQNPKNRLEVVKALLEKGADPRVLGDYYGEYVIPLDEAKDPATKALLEKAIEKLKKEEAEGIVRPRKQNFLVRTNWRIVHSKLYASL